MRRRSGWHLRLTARLQISSPWRLIYAFQSSESVTDSRLVPTRAAQLEVELACRVFHRLIVLHAKWRSGNTDTDTDRHEALIHVQSITRAATVFPIRVAKMHDFLALCRDADTRISIVSWYFINVLWYPYSSTRVPRSICKVWFMSIVPEYEYSFLVLEYHITYEKRLKRKQDLSGAPPNCVMPAWVKREVAPH